MNHFDINDFLNARKFVQACLGNFYEHFCTGPNYYSLRTQKDYLRFKTVGRIKNIETKT